MKWNIFHICWIYFLCPSGKEPSENIWKPSIIFQKNLKVNKSNFLVPTVTYCWCEGQPHHVEVSNGLVVLYVGIFAGYLQGYSS